MQRPKDFQDAAVKAATDILDAREITEEDRTNVDQYFHDIEKKSLARKQRINMYKGKANEIFEPILKPDEEVKPNKWVNILLIVIALYYLWTIYNGVVSLIGYVQCPECYDFTQFYGIILSLLYIPIVFYLLLKRKRWGWILLFTANLFAFILALSNIYFFFRYQEIHNGDTRMFVLDLLMRGAFVYFLWKPLIAGHFGVSDETKKRTAWVTTALTLCLILVLFITTR